jgi:uncharacterized DUF497 family protein
MKRTRTNAGNAAFRSLRSSSLLQRPVVVFPDPAHSRGGIRFKAIGKTDEDRQVLIVFILRKRIGVVRT